jgi:hypothetical protein
VQCPSCKRPVPPGAFLAETGPVSRVLFYCARCECGERIQRVTKPALLVA